MKYEAVIGLEIHAELKTKTKMFCFSLNDPNEKHPNINICPVCMGHPGTLPVINQEAVKKVIMMGLALGGKIPEFSQFDRKNYFYPDLPKGYQISQYQHPLVQGGEMKLSRGRTIRITRIHLEEDTGRLIHPTHTRMGGIHDKGTGVSLVDFNRAGIPLMEFVTEPDFRSGEEVKEFGEELQRILRYVGASDADMEKGQMRVEVNISIRPVEQETFGTKVEVKNINSFKFAADAIYYEIKRQAALLETGEKVMQETRGWNENKRETFSQRSKEEAHDYRYFPEPDLPPLRISRELVEEIRSILPELPQAKRERFAREYKLESSVIEILIRDKSLAGYFEELVSELRQHDTDTPATPRRDLVKTASSMFVGDFLRLLHSTSAIIGEVRITPENFAELALYLAEDKISNLTAKAVLEEMFRSGEDSSDIIDRLGLWQMSDVGDLENIASHIIKENPTAVEDYKRGKESSLQFLVGQIMKETRGKANPKIIQGIIKKLLL